MKSYMASKMSVLSELLAAELACVRFLASV